ncbi:MAG: hydrogenase expression/formation protein HypE [Actinomycetia bacterium]|nr:hydrogenase expression/formation protein HypE [Actinomycetes bacterium]
MNKKYTDNIIQLSHGDGGLKTSKLISGLILDYIGNETLNKLEDSAVLANINSKLAFTTDSFVVNPIFFPGGDIGKLSICGTINDLATTGCIPLALSLSFIIEEGFKIKDLKKILQSIKKVTDECKISIVTGDTKVVERGSADKLFINTSGIGAIGKKISISPSNIMEGDKIIINGGIAEHGISVINSRNNFNFSSDIISDCAPLHSLVQDMLKVSKNIHCLRDATRGGIATVLIELAKISNYRIDIYENKIPIKKEVLGICEFLGMDPLYIANEGKMIAFVRSDEANIVLEAMKKNKYGGKSCIIGEVSKKGNNILVLNTQLGTKRILDLLYSEQLPRIC